MIEIDVVIKMGEDCEKRMSLDEARMLHAELSKMFNGIPMGGNVMHRTSSHPQPQNVHPGQGPNNGIHAGQNQEARPKTGGCGCGKKKEAGPGPGAKRVEEVKAARAARVGRPKKKIETEQKDK